jgi:hypothetical protein
VLRIFESVRELAGFGLLHFGAKLKFKIEITPHFHKMKSAVNDGTMARYFSRELLLHALMLTP